MSMESECFYCGAKSADCAFGGLRGSQSCIDIKRRMEEVIKLEDEDLLGSTQTDGELSRKVSGGPNDPYLTEIKTVERKLYNPGYGDDRMCICGHPYYRHFDTYEEMSNIGCKYCQCYNFTELNDLKGG